MRQMKQDVPSYNSGFLCPLKRVQCEKTDFPKDVLKPFMGKIWFREMAVYDRLQYEFNQGGKEITAKVRIPRCYEIDSNCCVYVTNRQGEKKVHEVQNATHVTDKNSGVEETELTLIAPVQYWEVEEDDS